ncbi:MAG: phosphatidate cytidylyltransferase [Pseudolabrys sp.]
MPGADPVSDSGAAGNLTSAPGNNLALRVVSALVMAPLAVAAAWYGGWAFTLFWGLAAIAVAWEWIALVTGPGHRLVFSSGASALAIAALIGWRDHPTGAVLLVGLGALAATVFAPHRRRGWVAAGILYAGVMLVAPLFLRQDPVYGFGAIVFLFAVVWASDILAYFGGRTFGGPKLFAAVSPKKTWSGAICGTLGAIGCAAAGSAWFGAGNLEAMALVALVLSVASQGGDLFESWIKRRFGAKDASHLIPGHGGVMDRLDGFWAAALVGCLIGLSRGGFEDAARGLLVW